MNNSRLSNIDGFIFDLDGTIYLGESLLPGANRLLSTLRQRGKCLLFVTNKPLYSRQVYAEKLTHLGVPTTPEEVITSGYVLGYYLKTTYPDLNYYMVGEENLKVELRLQGLHLIDELEDQDEKEVIKPNGIEAVVVAFDRTLTYRKLNTAYQALINGAHFFATNPDKTCPMPGGGIPDAGTLITALEYLTGRKVEILAGKPSSIMVEVALSYLNLSPENCLLAGDRVETDILMGKSNGMHTALVLTGATSRAQANSVQDAPDLILENIGELLDWLD